LRRQGKTGLEIYAELGIETERERVQIRQFLLRQARHEPELALRNPPVLIDEIDAAKSEAKAPEDYSRREDYYPLEYWAKKWGSQPTPEITQIAMLLDEGQPNAEIVLRTGLNRGRVKRIRAALRDGRMRAEELDAAPPSPA
jgi:hypothetical protein